jgi:stearoyl-CoA desaturase (delta-9 desaturase)
VVNSLAHKVGRQRYATGDQSRNSFLIALITLGEGWHNNHHHYQRSERQGFYWWELDVTHCLLKALSWTGLVWDLHEPPLHVRDQRGPPDASRSGAVGFAASSG